MARTDKDKQRGINPFVNLEDHKKNRVQKRTKKRELNEIFGTDIPDEIKNRWTIT